MKRILFDVSRWVAGYLHREARGLEPAASSDPARLRLEDELFQKLFADSDLEPLRPQARDRRFGDWAERVHKTCDALPDFERLRQQCQGDVNSSALAVEALLKQLSPDLQEPPPDEAAMRKMLRSACGDAAQSVEELRDAQDGLSGLQLGGGAGRGRGAPSGIAVARRLKSDARLRRVAQLAGRFRRVLSQKRASRIRSGSDEIADVTLGGELERLIPAELMKLRVPALRRVMLSSLLERKCLQYRIEGRAALGRGPLLVALDRSGSMSGAKEEFSAAVALALLELSAAERRPFGVVTFDDGVRSEALMQPGGQLPESVLFTACAGGTDIHGAIARCLDLMAVSGRTFKKSDVVLVSDGESSTSEVDALRARAKAMGVTILGIGIEVSHEAMEPWCDAATILRASQLDALDDETAELLFFNR